MAGVLRPRVSTTGLSSPEWRPHPGRRSSALRHRLYPGPSDIHPGLSAGRRRPALVVSKPSDGSYAANGWYWLQEYNTDGTCGWYLFDSEGYMPTGYQVDPAGEVFLLCPVKGSDEGKMYDYGCKARSGLVEEYDMVNRRYVTW